MYVCMLGGWNAYIYAQGQTDSRPKWSESEKQLVNREKKSKAIYVWKTAGMRIF